MAQGDLFAEERSGGDERPLAIQLSPVLAGSNWNGVGNSRLTARDRGVGGVMIKRLSSEYGEGRGQAWWNWRIDPYTFDAVLIGVKPDQNGRKRQYTDYSFGVWEGDRLVTITRTVSGLGKAEAAELDRFVKDHITGRHGPLRSVEPRLVFKLAFDSVAESSRHRSGLVLRGARIVQWEREASAADAAKLEDVRALLGNS